MNVTLWCPSNRIQWVVVAVLVCATGAFQLTAETVISADGVVESKAGGFKFPDGSVQATADLPPLVVVDSNQDVVGPVLDANEVAATVVYKAADGNKLLLQVFLDRLAPTDTLEYETTDCTGTAYFRVGLLPPTWFPTSALRESTFYRPAPGAVPVPITGRAVWDEEGAECVDFPADAGMGLPVEVVPGGINFVPPYSLQGGGL